MTFSSAVSAGSSWNDWNTKPTLRPRSSARWSSSSENRSVPSIATPPVVGVSRPARIASRVDLPDPEAPTIAAASPGVISRSMSRRMTRSLSPLFTVLPMPRAARTLAFFTLSLLLFITLLAPVGVVAAEKSIVVLGDSVSAAYGLTQARGWVALLGERLKRERLDYIVVNASISGETTAGGLARINKVLERQKPAVVIIELGGNDGLRGLPIAEMRENLAAIIERSQMAGARVLLVGVRIPPNYGLEYSEAFAATYPDLAKRYQTAVVPYLMEGFGEKPEMFQPDRI